MRLWDKSIDLAHAGVAGCFRLVHRAERGAIRRTIIQQYPHLAGLSWDPVTSVIDYPNLTIGRNVSIGGFAYVSGPVHLGDDVMISLHCGLLAGKHRYDLPGKTVRDSGGPPPEGIVLEEDVWLAYGVTILDGVTVGRGSAIGARSLVLDDIPPFVLAAGSPCAPKKPRFDDDSLRRHLAVRDGTGAR